jgi:hypothetical protein
MKVYETIDMFETRGILYQECDLFFSGGREFKLHLPYSESLTIMVFKPSKYLTAKVSIIERGIDIDNYGIKTPKHHNYPNLVKWAREIVKKVLNHHLDV